MDHFWEPPRSRPNLTRQNDDFDGHLNGDLTNIPGIYIYIIYILYIYIYIIYYIYHILYIYHDLSESPNMVKSGNRVVLAMEFDQEIRSVFHADKKPEAPAMEHPSRLLWAPPGKISCGEFLALGVHGRHFTVLRCLFWSWFIYMFILIWYRSYENDETEGLSSQRFILQFPDEWAAMFRVRYPTDHQSLQHSIAVIPLGSQEKLYDIAKLY